MESLGVTRLTLSDFRCYRHLRLDTDLRPVVLTGPNGAGKTNILEALSFLAPGRGLRRARLAEVARGDAGAEAPWAVAAVLDGGGGRLEIGTGRQLGSERRVVRIGGQMARGQAALAEALAVMWLTPAMDRLFVEPASGRRRFLDRLVLGLDAGHAARSAAYEHALRERARLLKAGGDGRWLATVEEAMAENGVAVAAARVAAVARLDAACAERSGPFPGAALAVEGTVEGWLAESAEPGEAAARLRAALAAARRRDAESGGAGVGPHRSDFCVRHRTKDSPAERCSTGEQKALLISIVLAQARVRAAERGVAPLLLLDEVAAHLDAERRAALFDELAALGAQSWLSGTDETLFDGFGGRAQFFRVADATVARHDGSGA